MLYVNISLYVFFIKFLIYWFDIVGYIGIIVDDVYKVCECFEKLGVEFVKWLDDGKFCYV